MITESTSTQSPPQPDTNKRRRYPPGISLNVRLVRSYGLRAGFPTKYAIADSLGMKHSTFAEALTGVRQPEWLPTKLAELLGVTVDELRCISDDSAKRAR